MKNESGAWTSFLSLCFFASVAGRGFNRSCARTCHNVSVMGVRERWGDTMMTYVVTMMSSGDSDRGFGGKAISERVTANSPSPKWIVSRN